MTLADLLADLSHPTVTFAIGGVFGFFVSRFTLSKAERKSHRQRLYENARRHKEEKGKKYLAFSSALASYLQKKKSASPIVLDDFLALANTGDSYFNELRGIADAILGDHIDRASRDETFVPDIDEAIRKTIPAYYENLKSIAEKIDVIYNGNFDPNNYRSLIEVVEKYGSAKPMPHAANSLSSSG